MTSYRIGAFYRFQRIAPTALASLAGVITDRAQALSVHGLIVLAEEGINGTVAGPPEQLQQFLEELQREAVAGELLVKYSTAHFQPFRRFKVDIRPEIVTFDGAKVDPVVRSGKHLTPQQWHEMMLSDPDVVVLDARNLYEVALGKFQGAWIPPINSFGELRQFIASGVVPKDKKVLMYCTGGIRCEKASLEMEQAGYSQVYQLSGGILKYLEEYPNGFFEGECFVFDHRVAVDQQLMPSKRYKLCPHCGNPATIAVQCKKCSRSAVVCESCLTDETNYSCSKNCAYFLRTRPKVLRDSSEAVTNPRP